MCEGNGSKYSTQISEWLVLCIHLISKIFFFFGTAGHSSLWWKCSPIFLLSYCFSQATCCYDCAHLKNIYIKNHDKDGPSWTKKLIYVFIAWRFVPNVGNGRGMFGCKEHFVGWIFRSRGRFVRRPFVGGRFGGG
jgi:hypothetical protein